MGFEHTAVDGQFEAKKIRDSLVTIYENPFFVMKNNENKENIENIKIMFFIFLKTILKNNF